MRPQEREALRRRFDFRCGYCSVTEIDAGSELTVDHFQPRSQGGSDEPANWVYSCHACNEFKGDWWQPESTHRVLHPEKDERARHLAEADDGTLRPLTETGKFHIERLRLNRAQLVAFRIERNRREAAGDLRQRLLERLRELAHEVRRLANELERLEEQE
jgi:hypothetical protein